jgi:hypothetical protein
VKEGIATFMKIVGKVINENTMAFIMHIDLSANVGM